MLVHLINLKPEEIGKEETGAKTPHMLRNSILGGGNHLQYLALQGKEPGGWAGRKARRKAVKEGWGREREEKEGRGRGREGARMKKKEKEKELE